MKLAQVCREIGLPMVRAETVNDDPLFLDMTAERWTGRVEPLRVGTASPHRAFPLRLRE